MKRILGLFERRPILMQACSAGTLFVAGDIAAQCISMRNAHNNRVREEFDYARTLRLGVYGLFVAGPSMALWYRLLSNKIHFKSKAASVTARVVLDQTLFAPTFTFIFLAYTNLLAGHTIAETRTKIADVYVKVMLANYAVWPAVQLLNFAVIPVTLQSVFVNTVALGWNTYMSSVTHAHVEPKRVMDQMMSDAARVGKHLVKEHTE